MSRKIFCRAIFGLGVGRPEGGPRAFGLPYRTRATRQLCTLPSALRNTWGGMTGCCAKCAEPLLDRRNCSADVPPVRRAGSLGRPPAADRTGSCAARWTEAGEARREGGGPRELVRFPGGEQEFVHPGPLGALRAQRLPIGHVELRGIFVRNGEVEGKKRLDWRRTISPSTASSAPRPPLVRKTAEPSRPIALSPSCVARPPAAQSSVHAHSGSAGSAYPS